MRQYERNKESQAHLEDQHHCYWCLDDPCHCEDDWYSRYDDDYCDSCGRYHCQDGWGCGDGFGDWKKREIRNKKMDDIFYENEVFSPLKKLYKEEN